MKTLTILFFLVTVKFAAFGQKNSIVDKYGRLQVTGNRILSEKGDTVQLRGMSLFWSQWMPQYYNENVVQWLKEDWKCTVVRAAMGVEKGGYLENPEAEKAKVMQVVDAAIAQDLYVIIDYHSHEAHMDTEAAIDFFSEMAEKYGNYPHVIYEIYNEPLQNPKWPEDLKPYAEMVISAIRKHDPDNLVIMGSRQWSQKVSEVANDPVDDVNIAYALHFYPFTHGQWLRDEAEYAMKKGIALFVSEMGTCDASGNNHYAPDKTKVWLDFLDKHNISWCNWSVADKAETASVLKPGTSAKGKWKESDLTESGKFIRNEIITGNSPVWKDLAKQE